MPYRAKVYKVMIASPGDVPREREVIRDLIHEWNAVHSEKEDIVLMPVGWESHSSPSMGERAQAVINKQVLADCDLLIAVFWTRLGSPTGKARSGTVEEIEKHLSAGKPAMIYFSSVPVVPESVDQRQYKALQKFKEECRKRGLVETYDAIPQFRDKLNRQLAQTVIRLLSSKKNGQRGVEAVLVPDRPKSPPLVAEAQQLLLEASRDQNGIILKMYTLDGLTIQTNGRILVDNAEPRTEARWEAALRQLHELGLVHDRGYIGEVFALTHAGYRAADQLREESSPVPAEA